MSIPRIGKSHHTTWTLFSNKKNINWLNCINRLYHPEQRRNAAGDQLQGADTHGDQWGEEAHGLSDRRAEPEPSDGAGAHGQLGGEERRRQHHPYAGQSQAECGAGILACNKWPTVH